MPTAILYPLSMTLTMRTAPALLGPSISTWAVDRVCMITAFTEAECFLAGDESPGSVGILSRVVNAFSMLYNK